MTAKIKIRKFHIATYNHWNTVYEIMPRHGERAVSPAYAEKERAQQALDILNQDNSISRILRGELDQYGNYQRLPEHERT